VVKESDIQSQILRALGTEHFDCVPVKGIIRKRRSGVFEGPFGMFWRANCGGGFKNGRPLIANPAGTADILGCVNGKFVAIEVKQVGNKQSEIQRLWQSKVESAGGLYAVVYSVGEAVELVMRWAR